MNKSLTLESVNDTFLQRDDEGLERVQVTVIKWQIPEREVLVSLEFDPPLEVLPKMYLLSLPHAETRVLLKPREGERGATMPASHLYLRGSNQMQNEFLIAYLKSVISRLE